MTGRCLRSLAAISLLALAAAAVGQTTLEGSADGYVGLRADVVAEARQGTMGYPVELGRGPIDADGGFTLELLPVEAVPPAAFTPLSSLFPAERCDIGVSDPDARLVAVRDLRVIPAGAPCDYCGSLGTVYSASQPHGLLPHTGDLAVHWYLLDRDVTVRGSCRFGWGSESYDLTLRSGWNAVLAEVAEPLPTTEFREGKNVHVATGRVPASVRWYFDAAP